MSAIGDALVELDDLLAAGHVRYAIGGALALAYHAEPRATADIDLCVATPVDRHGELEAVLATSGWRRVTSETEAPVVGVRYIRQGDPTALDVFYSFDPYHACLLANAVPQPFVNRGARRVLPFVAANDSVVLKLSFGRPKDWVDVQALVDAGTSLDLGYVERQLIAFRGPAFHRHLARLRHMVAARGPAPSPQQPPEDRAASRGAATPPCEAWMPIARAHCILRRGHGGHHRSTRR